MPLLCTHQDQALVPYSLAAAHYGSVFGNERTCCEASRHCWCCRSAWCDRFTGWGIGSSTRDDRPRCRYGTVGAMHHLASAPPAALLPPETAGVLRIPDHRILAEDRLQLRQTHMDAPLWESAGRESIAPATNKHRATGSVGVCTPTPTNAAAPAAQRANLDVSRGGRCKTQSVQYRQNPITPRRARNNGNITEVTCRRRKCVPSISRAACSKFDEVCGAVGVNDKCKFGVAQTREGATIGTGSRCIWLKGLVAVAAAGQRSSAHGFRLWDSLRGVRVRQVLSTHLHV